MTNFKILSKRTLAVILVTLTLALCSTACGYEQTLQTSNYGSSVSDTKDKTSNESSDKKITFKSPVNNFTYMEEGNEVTILGYIGTDSDIVIPKKINNKPVTEISYEAFSDCTNLRSVMIPESVTKIECRAFRNCTSLTSITIPDNVTSIENHVFENCNSLENITISDSVAEIGYQAFYDTAWYENQSDGLVYAGKVLYQYKGEMPENTSIEIEDGTLGIAGGAFEGCNSLTSITIPDSITNIGINAFKDCSSLTSVTIPDSVTYIGAYSFFYCSSLTSITIPDNITSIDNGVFAHCESLSSITIPDSVTNIGSIAFLSCPSLKNVTIPNSVISMDKQAFGYIYDKDKRQNTLLPGFSINGKEGSTAEQYANDNNITFIVQ